MSESLADLEEQLDSPDARLRGEAVEALAGAAARGEVALPPAGSDVNLHCHTTFSYNAYGYSPSKLAWLGRRGGWAAGGIVDFDVLDGLDEFLAAGALLGLRACAGLETRVFVPEFAHYVMNSPGEPGVSYHMGVGFPTSQLSGETAAFLVRLRRTSEERNRGLVARVNAYLEPAALDYDRDVVPLTPAGNATERHICLAYGRRAHTVFGDNAALAAFWAGKLGAERGQLDLPHGPKLQALIRARTMKRGGVGYVQPDSGSFPWLEETNRFILAAGGIPTHTWLDGTSDGEQRIEELLQVAMRSGVCAINIIPDRNYGTAGGEEKLANLYHVVEVAQQLQLLIVVGTEMNNPGQKIVDDFASPELAPLAPAFLESAYAVYAHSVLQRGCGLGYTSEWAARALPERGERNAFFADVGRRLDPSREHLAAGMPAEATPQRILERIS
jgi:hypothetical protein